MVSAEQLREIGEKHMGDGGLFVCDLPAMRDEARDLNRIFWDTMPYGELVRYAYKANPDVRIAQVFDNEGVYFDASSINEAKELVASGIPARRISLSSQTLPEGQSYELEYLIKDSGLEVVATSSRQIEQLGSMGLDKFGIRVNAGIGSGHSNRTNVGGPSSSFGIWHHQLEEAKRLAQDYGVTINRLHTHIGSGADPNIWRSAIRQSLTVVDQLPDVDVLDMGGGYKVARMPDEVPTDMRRVAEVFAEEIERFRQRSGREIALEIEPGTFLVANHVYLLGRVEDIKTTITSGQDVGYNFIILNVGMNALLRPSLYGAQHPITVLNDSSEEDDFVVVGPACESGDILTPQPGDPEGISTRTLRVPNFGDIVAIGGAGAYGQTMAAAGYNQLPKSTNYYIPLN